jgi:hypothetical protein
MTPIRDRLSHKSRRNPNATVRRTVGRFRIALTS